MEQKLHRQEADLDSHIKAITSLESEKLDLIEGINFLSEVEVSKSGQTFSITHSLRAIE